ncbi:unnamed protein product [Hydatigera taeniaeformis]|uniref:Poly(U)-binding-splicing factor PUF60 n=1 Tax=Hydatigena taeniaeformis TaxID=6205 RepID=A0A0R3X6H1_HYDTA|nr:unnamed protein product [Hydatigera taeniaeformis]
MFNVDDLAYINAYRKSVTSNGTSETREPIVFGKDIKEVAPFTLITLSDEQKFAVERAKKYALEQSIQNAVRKQMSQLQSQDINNIKQTQALVLLSRIYVGSISFEIGEEEIRKAFSPYGPIKSISLSWDSALQKHKGFAFVEFEVPEAASLVLEQMNGFMIAGRGIKVGRPSNAPQTATLEAELRQDPSNKCRIYVAGVHPKLSEADIQTVFEAFGTVKSCILEPDVKFGQPEINHKGYGWIEFETEEAAIAAVTNMNGFEIAHTLLRVGRAITPKNVTSPGIAPSAAVAAAAASISARVSALENENASVSSAPAVVTSTATPASSGFSSGWGSGEHVPPPGVFVPSLTPAPAPLSTAPPPPSAVPVVLLENMVSAAEVDAYLEEEVAEECRNFGEVLRVLVHLMSDSSTVRIFVNFDSHGAAVNAVQALNGRFFDGHQVAARLYSDEEFQMRKLDL